MIYADYKNVPAGADPTVTAIKELQSDVAKLKDDVSDLNEHVFNRRIIFLGDSYGDGYSHDGMVTSWCDLVAEYVAPNAWYKKTAGGSGFVARSPAGERAIDLLRKVAATIDDKNAITDIVAGFGYNDKSAGSVEVFEPVFKEFAEYSKNTFPKATIHLFPIGWGGSNEDRNNFAILYPEIYMVSQKYGINYHYGAWQAIAPQEYFSSDWFHPNEKGQQSIARHISNALLGSPSLPVLSQNYTVVWGSYRYQLFWLKQDGNTVNIMSTGYAFTLDNYILQHGENSWGGALLTSGYLMGSGENYIGAGATFVVDGTPHPVYLQFVRRNNEVILKMFNYGDNIDCSGKTVYIAPDSWSFSMFFV